MGPGYPHADAALSAWRRTARTFVTVLCAWLLGATLAGCGGLLTSDAPPRTQWWLEPATVPATGLAPDRTLVVDVSVVPGLDTDRILNLDDAARLNSYAGAHWPDHLPEVLASLVTRSLEGAQTGPVRQGERAAPGDCLLRLEARSFQGRVDGNGVTERVEVALAGTLACPDGERTLSAARNVPVRENRMASIVAAFQAAFEGTLEDIAGQLAP